MPWFPTLIPGFPNYTGPYTVGSCDVELPVDQLDAPSPTPECANDIGTVAFRIFYPCEAKATERPIRWLPNPQRAYLSAYARFLGAHSIFAEAIALAPQFLYYATIPAHRNAHLLAPSTASGKWPVMVFSHGLGGSRNTYSHILGSLASHGIIVIAPDHRDGSAPVSFIRATSTTPARMVDYKKMSHTPTQEVYDGRDQQLKIRLWELGLIHDAIQKINQGICPDNLDPNSSNRRKKDVTNVFKMFIGKLDVQRPGSIIWAGHSFGAATTVQLIKSTYWRTSEGEKAGDYALFEASASSSLAAQITPRSPAIFLDMWCLPLRSPNTRSLWEKPMPCYVSSGPGGIAILSVLSEAFFKWSGNFKDTKRALSAPSERDGRLGPRFFYPTSSAHLSQSDFGILFPWITSKVLKADEPERYVKLNTRAILQMLREVGYEVASTSRTDMEEEVEVSKEVPTTDAQSNQDWRILDTNGAVNRWMAINVGPSSEAKSKDSVTNDSRTPSDSVVETEVLGEIKV